MQFRDFMVDIETLGKGPRAAVVQIGICGFNLRTGEVDSPQKWDVIPLRNATIDHDTVSWWAMQSEEARRSVFAPTITYAPQLALSKLFDYITICGVRQPDKIAVDAQFWAMPPSFDLVILENLYESVNMKAPWAYNATRCLRTLCDVANIGKEDRVQPTVLHDAGFDAEAQAKTAVLAWRRLTGVA